MARQGMRGSHCKLQWPLNLLFTTKEEFLLNTVYCKGGVLVEYTVYCKAGVLVHISILLEHNSSLRVANRAGKTGKTGKTAFFEKGAGKT